MFLLGIWQKMTTIKDKQFRIPVTDPSPILRQLYRLSYAEKEILAEQMEERKAAGFIRPFVTLDEIRCSSARRVRKPRLAFQQT
jgi:hypothetical protein